MLRPKHGEPQVYELLKITHKAGGTSTSQRYIIGEEQGYDVDGPRQLT